VRKVAWSPDGEHVTTAGDDTAKVWDPWTGETVRTLDGRTPVADLAWCPATSAPGALLLAVAGQDEKLRVFNLAVESGLPRQVEAGSPVGCLTWSPDGERLAAGLESGELLVCGPPGKETDDQGRRRTSTSVHAVTAIAWHPEGRHVLAVGDEDGLVWIWDLRRFVPAFGRVDVHADSFRGMVTANADLRDLIVNGSLRLVSRRATRCHALAWAPKGDRLVVVEDAIEVWDFDRTRGLQSSISLPTGHDPGAATGFTCVAWHPGGRSLAAGASDGRVVVFDLLSGQSIREYQAPAGVGSIAWNRRGRHLAAGSNDGTLTVWEFDRQRER
jgi:WD40 repeat protein